MDKVNEDAANPIMFISKRFLRPNSLRSVKACALMVSYLIAFPAESQIYRFGHCLFGCPEGLSGNQTLVRSAYTLLYDENRKSAVWVAYEVTAASLGIASSLSRDLIEDGWVSKALNAADLAALAEQDYVRSQHVPLVSFAGTPYWSEVNFASNATVRSRSLNQGAWYGLDWSLRNLVNREAAVYVYTGAIFDSEAEPKLLTGGNGYRIPDRFFKIVLTEDGRAAAFLFPQETAVHVHHCDLRADIEEIEALSGLTFFPAATVNVELSLYPMLGCGF